MITLPAVAGVMATGGAAFVDPTVAGEAVGLKPLPMVSMDATWAANRLPRKHTNAALKWFRDNNERPIGCPRIVRYELFDLAEVQMPTLLKPNAGEDYSRWARATNNRLLYGPPFWADLAPPPRGPLVAGPAPCLGRGGVAACCYV